MSYGIEVFNSAGETVFNSTNYIQLASATFTVVGTDLNAVPSGTGFVSIPDYCFGDDQSGYFSSGTDHQGYVISESAYSSVNQMALKIVATNFVFNGVTYLVPNAAPAVTDKLNQYMYGHLVTAVGANQSLTNGPWDHVASDFTNAYRIITLDGSVSSLRTSTGTRNLQPLSTYNARPVIYARPLSSSYVGQFGLRMYGSDGVVGRKLAIVDYTGNNNTFEVIIGNSAEEFGSITNSAKYQAGASPYGLQAFTANDQKYTINHPVSQFTTYDSATMPAQVILADGYSGGTAGTASTYSLGSLSTSSTKRWCRMNATTRGKSFISGSTPYHYWRGVYKWNSNNNILINWVEAESAGNGTTVVFSNYGTELPYAVVEFGTGA
jgi:hypothetical protein|tara:strand:- start:493 stop:1632 length:1140 start_codon:yes stop_codon:yes gene_type:complete